MGEMAEGEEKKGLRREDRGVRKNRGTRRYTRPRREGRQKVGNLERRKERERERERERGGKRETTRVSRGQFYTRVCKCRVIATARLLGHLFTHFDRKTPSCKRPFEIVRIGFHLGNGALITCTNWLPIDICFVLTTQPRRVLSKPFDTVAFGN